MIKDKNIVLGITGSIAAYKAADLASKLTQAEAAVYAVVTESAQRFISPLTLRSLTGHPVAVSMWELASEFSIEHVSLAETADIIVIAPATANIIAKLAGGIADDLLSCTVLASKSPVLIAPAMNSNMYENHITQENITKLKERGFIFVEPGFGHLACGTQGKGRLADVNQIIGVIRQVLGREGDLAEKTVVVTAGGTRESIDPVRFIGNRSSGKMGYALAEAARDRGAEVKLISTINLPEPSGVEVIYVETAAQMKDAVVKSVSGADVLVMAAAVADYCPREVAKSKIKKSSATLNVELVRTPDILSEVDGNFIRVGFAAESENTVANARKKLADKSLDLVVANDVTQQGSGFGTDTNKVTLISRDGDIQELPLMSKREVADRIWDWVVNNE
jgi:phosphopantothenoylcysteine decarboxylase/phosphopantothenate--cysteine ligase